MKKSDKQSGKSAFETPLRSNWPNLWKFVDYRCPNGSTKRRPVGQWIPDVQVPSGNLKGNELEPRKTRKSRWYLDYLGGGGSIDFIGRRDSRVSVPLNGHSNNIQEDPRRNYFGWPAAVIETIGVTCIRGRLSTNTPLLKYSQVTRRDFSYIHVCTYI